MRQHFTADGGSSYDPAAERKRRRQAILDDKNLNIWQKKYLLDQLEEKPEPPKPANPAKPVRMNDTKPQDKPRVAPVTNPFTYLSHAGGNPPEPNRDVTPSPAPAPVPAWPKPGSVEWLMERGVPREAAAAIAASAAKDQLQAAGGGQPAPTPVPAPPPAPGPGKPPAPSPAPATPPLPVPGPSKPPRPAPSPSPTPPPAPRPEPRPEPGPAPSPAPTPPAPPKDEAGGTPPRSLAEDKRARYEAERNAILTNPAIPETGKSGMLAEIDRRYGYRESDKGHAGTLQARVDELNDLKQKVREMQAHGKTTEMKPYLDRIDELTKGFGSGVGGLYGSTVDPSRVVDIALDGKPIGNARYKDGTATGNLDDVVKGLGGSVQWDRMKKSASVYDAEGNKVSTITIIGDVAVEKDKNGNIMKRYSLEGGQAQADIAEMARRMDVPYSYYHDKNGVYRAYAQPEMKDAPIRVVRKEGDVYIEANVEFTGKHANDIFPGSEQVDPKTGKVLAGSGKTYAELAYQGIMNKWNSNQGFNISGLVKDASGNYAYADNNDVVIVHTTLNSNYSEKDKMIVGKEGQKQNAVRINIDNNSILSSMFGLTSHVFTEDPKDIIANGASTMLNLANANSSPVSGMMAMLGGGKIIDDARRMGKNILDAIGSDEPVRLMDNWSIDRPGEVWLYDRGKRVNGKDNFNSSDWYSNTSGHEFGHVLGIGDAYPAFYRYNAETPEYAQGTNIYGENVEYKTHHPDKKTNEDWKKGDAMLSNGILSDHDVKLLLAAHETGEPQFFPRDPQQEKATKEKIIQAFLTGVRKGISPRPVGSK